MKILRKVGTVVDAKVQKKADQKSVINHKGVVYYATGKKGTLFSNGYPTYEYESAPKRIWADENGKVVTEE